MAPMPIALIGSGIFARTAHLPAIQAHADLFTLVAVYSRTLVSAATLSEGLDHTIDWYSEETAAQEKGYDNLMKREDVKGVIIALPILVQPEYIKQALQAGKHVLSEKPIAKDIETAHELLEWYRSSGFDAKQSSWNVAENFRFLDSFIWAAEEAKKLGRMLQFRTSINSMVKPGGDYIETAWRKNPGYQGGFLLDGGIHFVAATRVFLGEENTLSTASAFTTQLQAHLPPVDTINAVMKTKTGICGSFSVSFGTTFQGSTYAVTSEGGTVVVTRSKVAILKSDGEEIIKDFPDEGNGVEKELVAWAEGIVSGTEDPRLSPEEALSDLLILESLLKSGEQNGVPIIFAR